MNHKSYLLPALGLLAFATHARAADWPSTDMPPVILRDTRPDEWPDLRGRIETRLGIYLGKRPPSALRGEVKFEEVGRDLIAGLTRIRYRYLEMDETWTEAFMVLPPDFKEGERRPVMFIIHGTSERGKNGTMTETGEGRRAYATELARRGYITFAPDLFGYGETIRGTDQGKLRWDFEQRYPEWSQDDRMVFGLQRGLDLLDQLPMVRKGDYGAMGNSLGGGYTTRLMAADTRIKVGIASTGVSPQATNIYRQINKQGAARAKVDAIIKKTGRTPYEITDMLALCAPRALMVIEPFDDPYNPDVGATFNAVRTARMVWSLLGAGAKVSMLVHGDGHDTVNEVRATAYGWIERWLPLKTPEAKPPAVP